MSSGSRQINLRWSGRWSGFLSYDVSGVNSFLSKGPPPARIIPLSAKGAGRGRARLLLAMWHSMMVLEKQVHSQWTRRSTVYN